MGHRMPALLTLLKRAAATVSAAATCALIGAGAGATGTTDICTPSSPWVQSFNSNAPLSDIQNHNYTTSVDAVTATMGKYTFWSGIDHTGNRGYALYLNVADYTSLPGLLYRNVINVPAGGTLSYQNYARTHQNTPAKLRYEFTDTATGRVLQTTDGSTLTTGYTRQTVPDFVSSGSQVTLSIYTLKDGVSGDANILKLDDLKLSCTAAPATRKTDLQVFKTIVTPPRNVTTGKFFVGDTVEYALQVINQNANGVSADGATLTDVSEPGFEALTWKCEVVSGGAQCPASSGTGFPNFTIPKFPANSELKITYTGRVTAEDPQLKNTATITAPVGVTDTNLANNTDTVYICTAFPPPPSLIITKTGNGPWTAGQSGATYTLTVRNDGPTATSGAITVKDLLPAGITPATDTFSPATGWNCTTSGQTVTCTGNGVLNPGASVALTFGVNVSASAAFNVTNRASVGGGGDPDPIPDPASCTATGGQCAVYTTTVSVTPPVCSAIYALTLKSGSNNDKDGVTIRALDESSNTLGTTIATLPGMETSATLAVTSDARKFFVVNDSNRLRIYDLSLRDWVSGGLFTGVDGRLVRMTITRSGVGYAMDTKRNLWSFQTSGGYQVTALGQLTSTTLNAPSFNDNGDFFADSTGKLYMISSTTGSTNIDLWLITPATLSAEYLGRLSNPSPGSQFNGIAASPSGIYARDNQGRLVKIDLVNVSYTTVGGNSLGSTDLASCTYPVLAPNLGAVKSVTKVAGSVGDKVQPGDTLEYRVVIRNSGTLPAGGVTFSDALPAGTEYVADSARVNGFTTTVTGQNATSLSGAAYPFAQPVGICSQDGAACDTQVLKIDTTPDTLDNESVVSFRVTVVSPFTLTPAEVRNTALIRYAGGPNGGVPSNEVVTPVYQPAKLTVSKTVQNITRGGTVGTTGEGNPGDVLEYCITTTNVGGLNATNIGFSDSVPANTAFALNGFGAGKDIRLTAASGEVFYTAAADLDAGQLKDGKVLVQGGSFVLAPTQSVVICFRASIQ
ncbi:hypothetical protein GCM10008959_32520 [Deinococcus seoulensis]|uniref:DUF11 domain-containing protein n=1 Tax=Deinococcus seoulensis TaxID=1837379 RepID=A0ABQ2RUH4_9DEIO|nr:DUF11 domain-containing protein [Deinococcus seoulensis]GGR67871.1 hypothetical protein GCM10008959_32520 [Deinococcus seoulensis]